MVHKQWEVYVADEVRDWLDTSPPPPTAGSCRPSTPSPTPDPASVKAGRWQTWYTEAIRLAEYEEGES